MASFGKDRKIILEWAVQTGPIRISYYTCVEEFDFSICGMRKAFARIMEELNEQDSK